MEAVAVCVCVCVPRTLDLLILGKWPTQGSKVLGGALKLERIHGGDPTPSGTFGQSGGWVPSSQGVGWTNHLLVSLVKVMGVEREKEGNVVQPQSKALGRLQVLAGGPRGLLPIKVTEVPSPNLTQSTDNAHVCGPGIGQGVRINTG